MPWRRLTELDAGLNAAERGAYRSSLLGEGETDRLPGILSSVALQIRGAIRSFRDNVLDEDAEAVPESAVHHAGALIRYRLLSHFPGGASEPRRKEYEDALTWLRDVAAGRFLIEAPDSAPEAKAPHRVRPAFTRPKLSQRREDASGS